MLRNRTLEKNLGRRVQQVIKESDALCQEKRRIGRISKYQSAISFLFPFSAPFIGLTFLIDHPTSIILCGLSLLMPAMAAFILGMFIKNLDWSQDHYVLAHFPTTDAQIFRLQWYKCLKQSLFIPYTTLLVYLMIGLRQNLDLNALFCSIYIAASQWAAFFIIIMILAHWLPKLPYSLIGFGLLLVALCIFIFHNYIPVISDETFYWLFPWISGVFNFLFYKLILGKENYFPFLLYLSPLLISTPLIWKLRDSIQMNYKIETEASFNFHDNATLIDCQTEIHQKERDDKDIQDLMPVFRLSIDQLNSQEWETPGWIENLILSILNTTQRSVADCMCNMSGGWTGAWKFGIGMILIANIILMLFSNSSIWFHIVPTVLALFIAMPVFGGKWTGFQASRQFISASPIYANYPLGYYDICQVMLKINLIRCVTFMPFLIATGFVYGGYLLDSGWAGALNALIIGFILSAIQPTVLSMSILSSTLSYKLNIRRTFLLLTESITFLGSIIILFVGQGILLKGLGAILLVSLSILFWWVHGIIYNRGNLDLVIGSY